MSPPNPSIPFILHILPPNPGIPLGYLIILRGGTLLLTHNGKGRQQSAKGATTMVCGKSANPPYRNSTVITTDGMTKNVAGKGGTDNNKRLPKK